MGATKPTIPNDMPSRILTQVRDGGISKNRKPTNPPHTQAIVDLTTASEETPRLSATDTTIHAKRDDRQVEEDIIYMVMLDHRHPDMGEGSEVFALCPDLEEANLQARRCLEVNYGVGTDVWDGYTENEERDGRVRIEATGLEGEEFVARIEKKVLKRKNNSKPAASAPNPKNESPKYVYVVRAEYRHHVCGSNEDGEIESVDIDATFGNLEDANDHLRGLVEEKMETSGDLECNESEAAGLLHMNVLDMMEGEMSVYDVVKQPVW